MGTKPNKNLERVVEALKGMDCLLIIVGKMSEKQLLLLEVLPLIMKTFMMLAMKR